MLVMVGLKADGATEVHRFRVLRTHVERLRGLIGTSPAAEPVALMRCSSIHSFGMGYPIDVAVVGKDGRVISSVRALPPRRVFSARGGFLTLERPAVEEDWFEQGQRLEMVSLDAREEKKEASGGRVSDEVLPALRRGAL